MTWLLRSEGNIGHVFASQLIIVYMYTKTKCVYKRKRNIVLQN